MPACFPRNPETLAHRLTDLRQFSSRPRSDDGGFAPRFATTLDVLHVSDNLVARGFGADGFVPDFAELQRARRGERVNGNGLAQLECMTTLAEKPSLPDSSGGNRPIQDGAAAPTDTPWTEWRDEVILDERAAGDRILVTTWNNTYEIVVESPSTGGVLLRGGQFFPDFAIARIAGSLPGGSALKTRSINVGLRLEIAQQKRVFLTTPVQSIRVVPARVCLGLM